jgi:FkbM family methyltransferase
MKIPEFIHTRISSTGFLRVSLRELRELLVLYPESLFAQRVYTLLIKKYFFGKKSVSFSSICEEAWQLMPFEDSDNVVKIGKYLFKNDIVLKSEFAEIFFGEIKVNSLQKSLTSEQKVASAILGILSDGPYTNNNFCITETDVVVDAGANMGVFSIYAQEFTNSKVYAFEPQKEAISYLEKNINLNNCNHLVSIVPLGLSDSCGVVGLSVSHGSHSSSSIVLQRGDNEIINSTTLDTWAKENHITKIDFIKADIEGAERKMLIGAQEILKTMAPKLAICTYHLPDDPQVLENIILEANPKYEIIHTRTKLYASISGFKK